MTNFYEQVASNKRRSFFVIFFFIVFIITVGYFLSYYFDSQYFLPIAIIYSFGSAFGSYYFGDKIVLAINKAIPATRKDYFDFYTVTENLAMVAQIPVPKIYVIETDAMNAFATGRDAQHAVVCATTGLLAKLNRTELEGVIGHELSHIKNHDILLMTLVSVLIGTLSILINLTSRQMFWGGDRDNRDRNDSGIFAIIGLLLIIFAPLIAQLVQLAISRRREYFADASSVSLTHQPSGLISALKKISTDTTPFKEASTATASLYISNPFKGNKIASMFSTHPPIADRIKALEGMM
ncbi:MAG: M48 family metalloprotease [Candidatus Shapirobacteria bacterium]|jgi:heat shock protein HtpX